MASVELESRVDSAVVDDSKQPCNRHLYRGVAERALSVRTVLMETGSILASEALSIRASAAPSTTNPIANCNRRSLLVCAKESTSRRPTANIV